MPSRHWLADQPDSTSPGGGAEIRFILKSPRGDLTHAVCPAGEVSPVHALTGLDEAYYVLAGTGEIWRRSTEREAVTALRPGRWVQMPAGTEFQFRANHGTSLVFLVVVLPTWEPELFHTTEGGLWPPGPGDTSPSTEPDRLVEDWMSGDLHAVTDSMAPDRSEIRLLGGFEKGSLSLCTLNPQTVSSPVRHRTIHEIWYVVDGHGELWRDHPDAGESVVLLWPGVGVDIPTGAAFQFRATGGEPLRMVLLTMPRWPGPDEAVPAPPGRWRA